MHTFVVNGSFPVLLYLKNTLVFIKNSVKTINKKTIFEKNKISTIIEEKKETPTKT